MAVYHTDNLGMSAAGFQAAADLLVDVLKESYPALQYNVQKFFVLMPRL
jgi:hypothetical protein